MHPAPRARPLALMAALLAALQGPSFAAEHALGPAAARVIDITQTIDANNISMFVTNTGSFGWDKTTGHAGLEFPKGSGKTALFAAGLWLGGMRADTLRVTVSEYSDEYAPGAAPGGVPEGPASPALKVYKLYRSYGTTEDRDAALADYVAGAMTRGAPVVTASGPLALNIPGDQMLWCVYNDLDPNQHRDQAGKTTPLGIEVQQTVFAYDRPDALGNCIFLQHVLINRAASAITNMYASLWSDPDLGGYLDDLVGCDVARNLGFVYNSTNSDAVYGSTPPALGVDLLEGPRSGASTLAMTSFNRYVNGTDPQTATQSFNFMQGLNSDGSPVIDPVTLMATPYAVSGDPVTGTGWLDTNPSDRRMMLSSGPFTMAPGDTQRIMSALVIGQSTDRLLSVSLMKFYDDVIQSQFNTPASVSGPLPAPMLALAVSPNPSREEFAALFTLPHSGTARLELVDLAGRRVWSRQLVGAAAGPHSESVRAAARLAPGLYFLRLSQGGEQRTARVTSLR